MLPKLKVYLVWILYLIRHQESPLEPHGCRKPVRSEARPEPLNHLGQMGWVLLWELSAMGGALVYLRARGVCDAFCSSIETLKHSQSLTVCVRSCLAAGIFPEFVHLKWSVWQWLQTETEPTLLSLLCSRMS